MIFRPAPHAPFSLTLAAVLAIGLSPSAAQAVVQAVPSAVDKTDIELEAPLRAAGVEEGPAEAARRLTEAGDHAAAEPMWIRAAQAAEAAGDVAAASEAWQKVAEARAAQGQASAAISEALVRAVTLVESRLGPTAPELADPIGAQGRLAIDEGRFPEARVLIERALTLNGDSLERQAHEARLYYDLARIHDQTGDYLEAEAAARRSLDIRTELFGPVHQTSADSLNLIGNALAAQGLHAQADPIYRQVLGIYEVLYGPTDIHVAMALSNLGNSLRRSGRTGQAEPVYRRAVVIAENANDAVLLAQTLTNLGWFLREAGRPADAEPIFRRAHQLALQIVGPDHPFTGVTQANLGFALADQGRHAEAEPRFRDGLAALEGGLGPDSPDIVVTVDGYARTLAALGRDEEAGVLYDRSLEIVRRRLSPSHPDAVRQTGQWARYMNAEGRPDAALEQARLTAAALTGRGGRGRDWRSGVRIARPLFAQQVRAAWTLAHDGEFQPDAASPPAL